MFRRRTVLGKKGTPVKEGCLMFTATSSGTFKFTKAGLSYSTDGYTWTELAANTPTPTIAAEKKIWFKGTMTPSTSSPYGIGTFSSTGNFTASGTPMSLLFGDDFDRKTSLSGKRYAFRELFKSCTKLTSIDGLLLPATTLEDYCYYYMFYGCTGLTSIPSTLLPATTLEYYCYHGMFYGCTRLTSIPSTLLPATTLANGTYCYESMFYGCTGLTSIPTGLLPATTLVNYCYHEMFRGCTGLTSIPTGLLPATTLNYGCYEGMFYGCSKLALIPTGLLPATALSERCYNGMFHNCKRLTEIPSDLLPATTLANNCYEGMFQNCTNIMTAPNLTATKLVYRSYRYMFYGCIKLNSIRMLATDISGIENLSDWVNGVASSGTFYKKSGATIPTGASGIPDGWTVVNE